MNRRTDRQKQLDNLRIERGLDGNDWFFDKFENDLFTKPKRTFFKFGLVAIALNLLFWGVIIAMVVFGLSFVL